jgi:hypothetical protein
MGRQMTKTNIDTRKEQADFLLLQISPNIIQWRAGARETVSARTLRKLQAQHPNWMTDF